MTPHERYYDWHNYQLYDIIDASPIATERAIKLSPKKSIQIIQTVCDIFGLDYPKIDISNEDEVETTNDRIVINKDEQESSLLHQISHYVTIKLFNNYEHTPEMNRIQTIIMSRYYGIPTTVLVKSMKVYGLKVAPHNIIPKFVCSKSIWKKNLK